MQQGSQLFLAICLSICSLTATSLTVLAEDRAFKSSDGFTIDEIQLDQRLDDKLTSYVAKSATGRIDYLKKTISITIPLNANCPAGQRCPRIRPAPLKIELPIVDKPESPCLSTVYVAETKQNEDIGGGHEIYEQVEFFDHSTNKCWDLHPLPQVQIIYKKSFYDPGSHKIIKTRSEMSGQFE